MRQALHLDRPINPLGPADVTHVAAYHLQSGGQRLRARLALAAGRALGLLENDAVCIAACAELLHNASLIHDDIQDRDPMRRGQPAVWSKYGTNMAICSGDHVLSAAYGVLSTFSRSLLLPALLTLVHERTATAIDGQCADLGLRPDQPDAMARYIQIAKAKSGALLSLPVELMLLATGQIESLALARHACENFAVSYQIYDDLQDALADSAAEASSVSQPQCLNIVLILTRLHDYNGADTAKAAEAAAIDLGLQHLALCDATAGHMPGASGEHLLALSAQLRDLFSRFLPTVAGA
jgi:geranylgeranyl pyrophosphate synthase